MKTFFQTTKAAAAVVFALAMIDSPSAHAQQAQSNELGAMILLADGKRQRGFVQNSNENGVLFSLVEGAPGEGKRWGTDVVAVAFDDADEIMREPRAAFLQRDYTAAAEQFGKIADRWVIAAYAPNNFATEARYYQLESLRLLGRWAEMAPLLETPTAVTIPTKLTEFYQPQHRLNQLWAQLGAGNLEPVKAEIEARQIPQTGSAKLLPSPAYQVMPLRELVQITFLNAKVAEAEGKPELALADYYRTFSLTFGGDSQLLLESMKAALAIQGANPALQDPETVNVNTLRQMQSLAYVYKNSFAQGEIDSAFAAFAVKPDLPKPPAPKQAEAAPEEKPAAPADAKPAEAPKSE